jgi:hypothetical protein
VKKKYDETTKKAAKQQKQQAKGVCIKINHPRPEFGTKSFFDMKKMFFCFFSRFSFVCCPFIQHHYCWFSDELTTQDTTHMHWISLRDGFLTLLNVSAINNQHPGEVCNIITTETQEALIFGHRWSSSSSG